MPTETEIAALMNVPSPQHDVEWLKESLQTAIHLEFATIPPYLCAMWSIKSGDGPAYDHLREVVMEEMLHLGLACNMLTTIGGTPRLFPDAAAKYPCPLPGGVRPGLIVPLRGLTREGIKDVFMEIEKPHHDISGFDPTDEIAPTISEFYDAILAAFTSLPMGTLTGLRQLELQIPVSGEGIAPLFKIESVADAERAIGVIKEQGEGTSMSPFDESKHIPGDLAHYFRFGELYHGKKLVPLVAGQNPYSGEDIPFPETYPMAEVPPGGYQGASIPSDVQEKLVKVDQNYTKMVKLLHTAWAEGDSTALEKSVSAMYTLRTTARQLMQINLPSGTGTYGPCFRIAAS